MTSSPRDTTGMSTCYGMNVGSYHAIGDYDEAINTITRAIAATNNKCLLFQSPLLFGG